jgi:adenosylhomocysteinase
MSFANQFLSLIHLAKHGKTMKPGVYNVSREQDQEVARTKLETIGVPIDMLTAEQEKYLKSFKEGT